MLGETTVNINSNYGGEISEIDILKSIKKKNNQY